MWPSLWISPLRLTIRAGMQKISANIQPCWILWPGLPGGRRILWRSSGPCCGIIFIVSLYLTSLYLKARDSLITIALTIFFNNQSLNLRSFLLVSIGRSRILINLLAKPDIGKF